MKKTRLLALLCALVLLASLCSCGSSVKYEADYSILDSDSSSGSTILYNKLASSEKYEYSEGSSDTDTTDLTSERKIIRTVNETVETDRFDDFMTALDKAITEANGYSGSLRVTGNGYGEDSVRYARLTVYVPAENLDTFTSAIGTLGAVTQYEESTNDVTEAYIDVESRITVLEAEEASLLAMLSKAETVSDMLAVRNQLTDVQQDLASLRAQKTSYDKRVAYSTVYLSVSEVEVVTGTEEAFFTVVGETFVESLEGVVEFLRGLGIVLFGGFPIIVLLAAIGVGIFFIIRAIVKHNKKRKAAQKAKTE